MRIDTKLNARSSFFLFLAWGIVLSLASTLSAQNASSTTTQGTSNQAGSSTMSSSTQTRPIPSNDNISRQDVADLDRFLDSHPEIAEQLRKDPSLVDNRKWVSGHPALQDYLKEHPEVAESFRSNPNVFMQDENSLDRNDISRRDVADMDRFLDKHPEIAEQLRKDPSLIDNHKWVSAHPALQDYLKEHPEVAESFRSNPNVFMQDENRYDHQEAANEYGSNDRDRDRFNDRDRDRFNDRDRGELTNFGHFLGEHSSMATELQRDPSLANNQEYRSSHPELDEYLKAHPAMSQQLSANPQAVMNSNLVQPNGSGAPGTTAKPMMPKPKSNPNQ
jgi:hypothetical protein